MISMVVESTKKTYNMFISVFLSGSRWARNYFLNVKTKVVASDSRKANGAQCRHRGVVRSSKKKFCLIS